jgi:3-oxoacyl-[acyl-carrier-protein] synthase-1
MGQRVFVTGVGIVSAIGNGTGETLASIKSLSTGIGKLSLFGSIHGHIPVAEIKFKNSQLANLAGIAPARTPYSRNSMLALIAARDALAMAGWDMSNELVSGAIMATTAGGMDLNEQYYNSLLQDDSHKDVILLLDSADCTEKVANMAGIRHKVTTISTACSSSANSIMLGARLIKNNRIQRALVGGTDALTRFTLNGFFALEILSVTGCRPFDRDRNGLTIGEGAAVLILESGEVADPAKIICEITGYANANEAFHATASSADGLGAGLAMSGALESASLRPDDIGYINAHGTGTGINDLSEGRAIENVFGPAIPPVSSTKAFTGHTLGAAGAVEAVFSILALQNQIVLPGLNFSTQMEELHFQPVRCEWLFPPHVRCDRHEHAGTAGGLASRGRNCC